MNREKPNTTLGGFSLSYPPIVDDLTAILERTCKSTAIGPKGAINPLGVEKLVNIAKKIETELKFLDCHSEVKGGLITEDNYSWFCVIRFVTPKLEVAILIPHIAWSRKEKWRLERSVAVCGKGSLKDGPQDQGVIYRTRDQIFEELKRELLELAHSQEKSPESVFIKHI